MNKKQKGPGSRHKFHMCRIAVIIFLTFLLSGCSGRNSDARLTHIAGMVSDAPAVAMAALDSISYGTLSDLDRHLYDLLSIKARDKAYVMHTSDSLILDVIDYYASHGKDGLYPEALYYGGRVYSDMGDYPTALDYFRKSLDKIPDKGRESMELKVRVLSQTARLLIRMRLHTRAMPYLMEALEIDSMRNDTFRLAYDNELLGSIFLRQRRLHQAEESFARATRWAAFLSDMDRAHMQGQLAITRLLQGDTASAVKLIAGVPARVRAVQRNEAMIYASDIYKAAGMLDSALIYADRLVHNADINNRKNGYRNMFSAELANMIPTDSLAVFIRNYYRCLEDYYNDHDSQLIMLQEAMYDYQMHERERLKAEKSNITLMKLLYGFSFVVLLMGIVILFLKNRNANAKLELHAALENIERLSQSLSRKEMNVDIPDNKIQKLDKQIHLDPVYKNESAHELRNQLRKNLYELYNINRLIYTVDPRILNSETYGKVLQLISDGKILRDDSELWPELQDLVLRCSPDFIINLRLLLGGRLTSNDLHTSLLIKCGIQPSQMSILLNRSKGAIVSCRESLCLRVFDEKLGTKVIDGIIRLL